MSKEASAPRALLVSPDALVRAGLRGALKEGGWAIAGEANTLEKARALWRVEVFSFEVVLWDAGHPPDTSAVPDIPPVVALVQDEAAARAVLAAGVAGAVLRLSPAARVCAALSAATQGLTVSERAFQKLRPRTEARADAAPGDFTPREREVLGLLAEGLHNRAIAERLGISRHTVKFHVNALLQKLGVLGRTEAVVRAARLGLVVL
jgi:two-component system nitrate/nitrite response regulator NarL